jgi:hypothetical protein
MFHDVLLAKTQNSDASGGMGIGCDACCSRASTRTSFARMRPFVSDALPMSCAAMHPDRGSMRTREKPGGYLLGEGRDRHRVRRRARAEHGIACATCPAHAMPDAGKACSLFALWIVGVDRARVFLEPRAVAVVATADSSIATASYRCPAVVEKSVAVATRA